MAADIPNSPKRFFRLWAAIVVLMLAVMSFALASPPPASADCLTSQDHFYIALLAQRNIGPKPGYTECDLALHGRQTASVVRQAANPRAAAAYLALDIYYNTDLTADQAAWQVAAAVSAYAPEMIPIIRRTPVEEPSVA
ncbi:hypothetical protein BST27_24810 [Mycobacterium intermedium]|uniref:Uncharacterized protein n=1 Tax=Mycobacterium intermedium TaxID=28445 RepID=A0A1E3S5P2_MYCIE|nr:DUF732 domain-containing protein [Mycobacterium intermedium]MCV6962747.1 DUF732 domain-containing protein [Mycobacterium intermedium]ODQ97495.1 hypothetical protein BHQ20_26375 [Mycobacterium intermedium]OPE47584.1 hypothetical protein BV508_21490 [Mycobacterium intermedium]ORA96635.1 hypothetical protein BST27_24810 [Mycobacterium intermedium]